jgi:hypothetical protein
MTITIPVVPEGATNGGRRGGRAGLALLALAVFVAVAAVTYHLDRGRQQPVGLSPDYSRYDTPAAVAAFPATPGHEATSVSAVGTCAQPDDAALTTPDVPAVTVEATQMPADSELTWTAAGGGTTEPGFLTADPEGFGYGYLTWLGAGPVTLTVRQGGHAVTLTVTLPTKAQCATFH